MNSNINIKNYINKSNVSSKILNNIFGIIAYVFVLMGYIISEYNELFFVFYIGCIFIVLFGLHSLIKQIYLRKINIGSIISSQTVVWHALPFTYIGLFGYENYVLDIDQISNIRSCFMVVTFCIIPFLYFEKYGKYIEYPSISGQWKNSLYVIFPFALIQIFLILTGDRSYASSTGLSESGNGGLIYQFLSTLFPAIMPLCSIYLAIIINIKNLRGKYFLILMYIFIIVLQILWFYTAGRRPMALLIFLSLFSFMSVRFTGPMNIKKLVKIFVILALSAQAVWFFWNSYFALRVAYDETGGTESVGILNIEQARSVASSSDADEQFRSNTIVRPFSTISSLTTIQNESTGYLLGWNALSQALLTIPSAIFPNKFSAIGPVFEDLYYEEIGVSLTDYANTIFLEGYIDFGYFGSVLYIFIAHLMLTSLFRIKRIKNNENIYNLVYFTVIFQIVNIETTLTSIFVCILSIFLFIFIFILFDIIFSGSKLRKINKIRKYKNL